MSSDAITRRLKQVDQLRELSMFLINAKKDSDAKKQLATDKQPIPNQTQDNRVRRR